MTKRNIHPAHPGEHLMEYLEEFGLSQYRLAKDIHVLPARVNEIVLGKRAISADTALRLGRYFSTSAQYWINLQANYDLQLAKTESGELITREVAPLEAA